MSMLPENGIEPHGEQYPSSESNMDLDGPPPLSKSPAVKRISRACIRCRQRKSKCNLGTLGQPTPCESCARDQVECVLATSRRGGRRVKKGTSAPLPSDNRQGILPPIEAFSPPARPPYIGPQRSFSVAQVTSPSRERFRTEDPITKNIDETIASTDLHTTSDALNMLSQAAQLDSYSTPAQRSHTSDRQNVVLSPQDHPTHSSRHSDSISNNVLQYPLISQGLLTVTQVSQLVERFKQFYHPYLPIAPRKSFEPESLQYMATYEPHLLTAIITVAARDLPQGENILRTCSHYMHQLVSEISAGKRCDVEAVEALLLLAEWEPQDSLSEGREVGCGEEDRAAWMHVGIALRTAYFLGLDRTAIKHDDDDKAAHLNRRRITWSVCYISDRSLSARIGRAFWSRGPVALSGVGKHGRQTFDDFLPLQPQTPDETDYASILQANLDLIQLFCNVHDILYSGMGSSMKMMLAGNYVKYVDDFRRAIEGWKSVWGTLTCPPNIKATLQMSYEYLRLYTNAYAFQATVTRAVAAKSQGSLPANATSHMGVPSLPDARFIYESVDAAKSLLSIINSYIDAETCLRYLPLRFSLYCVNSAVFLYKAWSFDVLSAQEKLGIRHMINDVIRRLQKASVRPNDFSSRYSELLDRLWQRKDSESQTQSRAKTPNGQVPGSSAGSGTHTKPGASMGSNGVVNSTVGGGPIGGSRAQDASSNTNAASSSNPNFLNPSTPFRAPSTAPHQPQAWQQGLQDEFSWLDLQAVGELVSGNGGELNGSGVGWGAAAMMDGGGFGYGFGFGFGGGGNGWETSDGWGGDWGREAEDGGGGGGGGKFF